MKRRAGVRRGPGGGSAPNPTAGDPQMTESKQPIIRKRETRIRGQVSVRRRRRPPGQADGPRRGAGISPHPPYPENLRKRRIRRRVDQASQRGTRSTLTLKQVADSTSIDGTTEIETEVTDLLAMAE